ncbi:hypothetical protein DTL21_28375 [Bremerella cremea]|uniref:Uncharacterized protein n=1 Tax=Blastopirellula marina TaxID=124 RepID=A0A2S8F8P3_9BACT|nr:MULTISPECIES: hypothetical protein [Pirellulaceae]PQO28519.1 hypothetical protein C5Y83_28325 [Blastopirellula marina]RCS41889.1 hypothetical protein DTL21_28375 [Bremerella cremea]
MLTAKRKLHFNTDSRGRKRIDREPKPKPVVPQGRVPRVSKLLALAIHFQQLLDDRVVADQSDLAWLSQVTQPRITQIMNLLMLSPEIQEEILQLPKVVEGKDPIHEKLLRPIAAEVCFRKQFELWQKSHGLRTSEEP